MTLPHVAFVASDDLARSSQEYIDLISSPGSKPSPALLGDVMNHFTRDIIDAFMLAPMEKLQIGGAQRKLVEFLASTVKSSTAVVLKATLHRLDQDQHRRSAEAIDRMRLVLPHAEKVGGEWHVSFLADDAFVQRARAAIAKARNEGPRADFPETVFVMKALTDQAIRHYYEEPIKLLNFGMILGKVSDVAISGVRKGSYSTIDSLLPRLSDEQLMGGVDYFDAMLIDVPKQHIRVPIRL